MTFENAAMRHFLQRAFEAAVPDPEGKECASDEEACLWLHPIHGAGWVNGKLTSVYADLDGLITYILTWLGNVYISTACQHGNHHKHCQNTSALDGSTKIPARCKFCQATCFCPCHRNGRTVLSLSDLRPYMHHEPNPSEGTV